MKHYLETNAPEITQEKMRKLLVRSTKGVLARRKAVMKDCAMEGNHVNSGSMRYLGFRSHAIAYLFIRVYGAPKEGNWEDGGSHVATQIMKTLDIPHGSWNSVTKVLSRRKYIATLQPSEPSKSITMGWRSGGKRRHKSICAQRVMAIARFTASTQPTSAIAIGESFPETLPSFAEASIPLGSLTLSTLSTFTWQSPLFTIPAISDALRWELVKKFGRR